MASPLALVRSTRNANPVHRLPSPVWGVVERPKKLTPKRYELISSFLRTVALKNVKKYGGEGKGRLLWRKELLKRLKSEHHSRGRMTTDDLNSWLKNENLASLVKILEESTAKPSSGVGPKKEASAKKRPPSESGSDIGWQPTTGLERSSVSSMSVPAPQKGISKKACSSVSKEQDVVPGFSGHHNRGRKTSKAKMKRTKLLTRERKSLITEFVQTATNEAEEYASRKNMWRADLLVQLNQLPGRNIAAAELDYLLCKQKFRKMVGELECALERGTNQSTSSDTEPPNEDEEIADDDTVDDTVSEVSSDFLPHVEGTIVLLEEQIQRLNALGKRVISRKNPYYVDKYKAMVQSLNNELEGISTYVRQAIPTIQNYSQQFSKDNTEVDNDAE